MLDTLQIATMRTDRMTAVIKGGHNAEGHNHNDVGNFILFSGSPLIIDVGVGVYTRQTFSSERYSIWIMQSSWHNLPEINGHMQPPGGKFRASAFTCADGTASLTLTDAYPPEAGLVRYVRTLSVRGDDVTLNDRYAFAAKDNTVTEHFMTREEPVIEGNRVRIGECRGVGSPLHQGRPQPLRRMENRLPLPHPHRGALRNRRRPDLHTETEESIMSREIAIVTGCLGGIGYACTQKLPAQDFTVVGMGTRPGGRADVDEAVAALGGRFTYLSDNIAADSIQEVSRDGDGFTIRFRPVRPIPHQNESFETVWRRFRQANGER